MKKKSSKWILTAAVIAVAAAGVVWHQLWKLESQRKILFVAYQLQVPDGWKLKADRTEPPSLICLGGNRCPSVTRHWEAPQGLMTEEFMFLYKKAGWDLTLERECIPKPNGGHTILNCSAYGTVGGYDINVYYMSNSSKPSDTSLSLHVD